VRTTKTTRLARIGPLLIKKPTEGYHWEVFINPQGHETPIEIRDGFLPSKSIGYLIQDKKYRHMYRVRTSEVTVSNLLNKTRAKELSMLIREKANGTLSSELYRL